MPSEEEKMRVPSYKDVLLGRAKAVCPHCQGETHEECQLCSQVHCQWYCCGCRGFALDTKKVYFPYENQPKPYGGNGVKWFTMECELCGFVYSTSFE